MNRKAMFSSNTDNWATPQYLFNELNDEFSFLLDPCADQSNHKCAKYYTKQDDGLSKDWSGETVFCNPPYGRAIKNWVKKCFDEVYNGKCQCAVMLIPSRTDTAWFHDFIYQKAQIRFIRGRLRFGDSTANAPFPSMVVVFKK